jgi:outer membrane protein TolC
MIDNYLLLTENPPDTMFHPGIQKKQFEYLYSLQQEQVIDKLDLPSIVLQGAAWGRGSSVNSYDEFRKLSTGLPWERGNYLVGLGISYTITDRKRKQLELRTQQAKSSQLLEEVNAQKAMLKLQQQQADAELKTAYDRIREIPKQLNAAEAAYRQKLALYRNGLSDLIELNTALSILYRAETDFTSVKFLFCQALINKAMAENQLPLLIETLN